MKGFPDLPRSRVSVEAATHSRPGKLTLQVCGQCETVQYPYREVCRNCLSNDLSWQAVDGSGEIIASSRLFASTHPYFRDRSPYLIASVKLRAGPIMVARLEEEGLRPGTEVCVVHEQLSDDRVGLVARAAVM